MDLDPFRAKRDSELRPPKPKRPPRHRAGEWFLKGPIPGTWITRAARLSGRAFHVGMALWYLAGLEECRRVKLTGKVCRQFGLLPDAARRGLAKLESAGLVTVDRHPGRCPVVTIQGVS